MGSNGDLRDRERRRGAVHGEDVVGVDVIDRHRLADELGLPMPSLREQRPDRPVDHARGKGCLLPRPRLAAEEGAGDLAGGVVALLDVDREGQEVHVALVAGGGGTENHGVAGAHDHGSARLSGELAGLEGDLGVSYLHRDAANVEHAHLSCSFRSPGWRPHSSFQNSRSLTPRRLAKGIPLQAAASEASSCSTPAEISRPPANAAGVPATPARIPDSKSRRTRSSTAPERRSALKRSRSSPKPSARSQRWGSSMWPRSAKSESHISQKAP